MGWVIFESMPLSTDSSKRIEELLCEWFGEGLLYGARALDDEDWEELHPQERALVERAVGKRRREFAGGRVLARHLLDRLGVEAGPLLTTPSRAPAWPEGTVGSISHTHEECVVVVGAQAQCRSVGVDLEMKRELSAGMMDMILVERERRECASWALDSQRAVLLAFCLKEAFYKFQSPLSGCFLGFHDVRIEAESTADRWRIVEAEGAHPRARSAFGALAGMRWQAFARWLDKDRVLAMVAECAIDEAPPVPRR